MAKKPARKSRPDANGSAPKPATTNEHAAADALPVDPASDARTRHDAQRKEDEAKLLANPVFRAAAEHDERGKLAQRAAAEAAAPFRAELDKLIAAHPNGCAPNSDTSKRFDALIWAIQDAETKGFAEHGFRRAIPPKSPAELLARLKRVELNWWFDLQEAANLPRPSELLWQDAERLRKCDPFLPALPAKPDDGRERYAVLVRWCEQCIALAPTPTGSVSPDLVAKSVAAAAGLSAAVGKNGDDGTSAAKTPSKGNRKRQARNRSKADKVREILSGSEPFERTKTELARQAGYTDVASLANVKNFDNLWSENERKRAGVKAERERRMRGAANS